MCNKLVAYKQNTSGSVATMMAVMATTLLIGIGVAVDYGAMVSKRSYLQNVADSAILAAVVSGEADQAKLQAIAAKFIASTDYPNAVVEVALTKDNTAAIQVTDPQKLLFMGAFGEKNRPITASTEVPLPGHIKLNLAMVLDTTDSMAGEKIEALKSASDTLLSSLGSNKNANENVKISLVPFANYVRLSTSYAGETWLDVEPPREQEWQTLDKENSTNCRDEGSGETLTTVCDDYVYTYETVMENWEGCMASRRDGYHEIAPFNGRRMQGIVGVWGCDTMFNELVPLSADIPAINQNIQNFETGGTTYLPAGLIWGWRTLQASVPFTEASKATSKGMKNVMLLMTDGSNTTSIRPAVNDESFRKHDPVKTLEAEQRVEADIITETLCDSIKRDGIQLITVAFEVEDNQTKNLLRECASYPEDFYEANNVEALKQAFSDIGSGLTDVRLIR